MTSKKQKIYVWGLIAGICLGSGEELAAMNVEVRRDELSAPRGRMTDASVSIEEGERAVNWRPSLDVLRDQKVPTHFLLSKFLQESRTFPIMRAARQRWSIRAVYLPYQLPLTEAGIDREGLCQFMKVFRDTPFLESICVSDPYKSLVGHYVDEETQRARLVGGINFIRKGRCIIGDNRDGEAFLKGAEGEGFEFNGASMVFFGCGGVSSAVSIELALANKLKRVVLIDSEMDRRDALAEKLKRLRVMVETFSHEGARDFSSYDTFYNGTGLGKAKISEGRTPLNEEDILPEVGVAIDANYTPWETPFLNSLKRRGFRTLNGFSHMIASTSFQLQLMAPGQSIEYEALRQLVESEKLVPQA